MIKGRIKARKTDLPIERTKLNEACRIAEAWQEPGEMFVLTTGWNT